MAILFVVDVSALLIPAEPDYVGISFFVFVAAVYKGSVPLQGVRMLQRSRSHIFVTSSSLYCASFIWRSMSNRLDCVLLECV